MVKVELVKGQWTKLEKMDGIVQLISTSQESKVLIKTSETGEVPTDDLGFVLGSWQGPKNFQGNGKTVYAKLVKGTGYLLIDNMNLGSYARIKVIYQEIQVAKQEMTLGVNSQTKLALPPSDKFSGQYWRADTQGIVSVNAYTGEVLAINVGQVVVKGFYGSPYVQLGVEYHITVNP